MRDDGPIDYALRGRDQVQGWFYLADALLFVAVNDAQAASGDLLEIGAYLGKSAILLGYFPRDNERLVVVDLFGRPTYHDEQRNEQSRWYGDLTRERFEANFAKFHHELPEIRQGLSSDQLSALPSESFRLIHIDGSHEHEAVRADIVEAVRLAGAGAVIVLDDVLSAHTPGVSAAAWEAVARGDLIPLVQSHGKLYTTPGRDPLPVEALRGSLAAAGLREVDAHIVYGHPVLEVGLMSTVMPQETIPRRVIRDLTPPAIARLGRRLRR